MTGQASSVEAVLAAERGVYGPVAEAQSLMELYRTIEGPAAESAFACLSSGVLERLVDAFEAYQSMVSRHGRPSTQALCE